MPQHNAKARKAARRRASTKKDNYGAELFHEVKRYDGAGNLIETVSTDELMARPIGATRKYGTMYKKKNRGASLHRTNGEGPMEEYNKIATKVKKGARVGYKAIIENE